MALIFVRKQQIRPLSPPPADVDYLSEWKLRMNLFVKGAPLNVIEEGKHSTNGD